MDYYPPPKSGQWTTGICGCFEDLGSCCMGCWCPCVSIGRYIEVLDRGATPCFTAGAIWTVIQCFTGFGCIYTCGYRERLRQKYGLPDGPCGDFCTDCCCQACSTCQITRELKNRNVDPALGYEGVKHIYDQPYGAKPPNQQQMMN